MEGSADSLQNLPQVVPEQILSGLCESYGASFLHRYCISLSTVCTTCPDTLALVLDGTGSFTCFAMAAFNYPGVVTAWGVTWNALDHHTRTAFLGPGAGVDDMGLSAFLKLTRRDDLRLEHLITFRESGWRE